MQTPKRNEVNMKVLFACGGSGGHINPALAMAEMLKKAYPSAHIAFSGRTDGMEHDMVKKNGYPFFHIPIDGFHRNFSCRNVRSAFLALSAPKKAKSIMNSFGADLVIGTGGYVTYPFIKAAHALGIPSLVFESNAVPGLAVRMCERSATRTILQFEECLGALRHPEKARVIGAPLREDFYHMTRAHARSLLGIPQDIFLFLSFGGSLGASVINRACLTCMEKLQEQSGDILHIHACGKRYYERLRTEYPHFVGQKTLFPYIEKMPLYMSAANMILCRAGAITLAELARTGRAAILVPSPNVAADHQRKNAYAYGKEKAAWVVEEGALDGEELAKKILHLKNDSEKITKAEHAVKHFDTPDTPRLFLEVIASVRK
jgi:UDP-N-acetylglucosamine--N-acetylmuramyl-(pentapeptide) pyrophosphoryl-undecaprenol N-acetylglucosamine transferase